VILPTKGLSEERALIVIGAEVLRILDRPMSVSTAWDKLQRARTNGYVESIRYDWFVLALDLLFSIGALTLDRGRLKKAKP